MYWLAKFGVKKLSTHYMLFMGTEYIYGISRSVHFYNCYEYIIDRYGVNMYRHEYIINRRLLMYNQYKDYKLSGRCWLNAMVSRLYINNLDRGIQNQLGNSRPNNNLLCTMLNYANDRHVGDQYAIYTDGHIEIIQVPGVNHMDFLSRI